LITLFHLPRPCKAIAGKFDATSVNSFDSRFLKKSGFQTIQNCRKSWQLRLRRLLSLTLGCLKHVIISKLLHM